MLIFNLGYHALPMRMKDYLINLKPRHDQILFHPAFLGTLSNFSVSITALCKTGLCARIAQPKISK